MSHLNPPHALYNTAPFPSGELFVGNLSYFCQDSDLHALFAAYAHVESARVVVNDSRQRSLMFGFVVVHSEQEARQLERLLDNHLFMGRRLKVKVTSDGVDRNRQHPTDRALAEGVQVHISISSAFPIEEVILPTECLLRRELQCYGFIIDVAVKHYSCQDGHQTGYGFAVFEDEYGASQAVRAGTTISVDGVSLVVSWPRQPAQPPRRLAHPQAHPQGHTLSHTHLSPPPPAPHNALHGAHTGHSPLSQHSLLSHNTHSPHNSLNGLFGAHNLPPPPPYDTPLTNRSSPTPLSTHSSSLTSLAQPLTQPLTSHNPHTHSLVTSTEDWWGRDREREREPVSSVSRYSLLSHTTQPSSSLNTQQAQGTTNNALAQREEAPALSGLSRQFQPLNLLDDTPWPL